MKKRHSPFLFFLFLLVFIACKNNTEHPELIVPKVGAEAPDFLLLGTGNDTVKLSDHRGKIVLIDFWASWCGPCRKKNPHLVELYNKYGKKTYKNASGFEIIGISQDNKEVDWLKAIQDDHLTWIQVNEKKSRTNDVSLSYGIKYIPTTFLINAEGKILLVNPSIEETAEMLNTL